MEINNSFLFNLPHVQIKTKNLSFDTIERDTVESFTHEILLGDRDEEVVCVLECISERLFPILKQGSRHLNEYVLAISLPTSIKAVLSETKNLEDILIDLEKLAVKAFNKTTEDL